MAPCHGPANRPRDEDSREEDNGLSPAASAEATATCSQWLAHLGPWEEAGVLVQVTGCRPTPRGTLRACFFLREQGYMLAAQPPPPSDLGPVCAFCQDVGPAKEANACLSVCLSVCPSVLTFSLPLFLLLFPNWPFR